MKNQMQNLVSFIAVSLLVGCVGAQFNDVAPIQSRIEDEYSKSKQLFDQSNRDYAEKTYVYKNLVTAPKANGLDEHYKSMTTSLETLTRLRDQIEKSKDQFTLATKDKKQISSKDMTWKDEQTAITSFNDSMNQFNRVLSDYSRESSTFGHILTDNHIVVMAKVSDIRSRMADNIDRAKKNLRVLDADIQAAKKLAKQNGKPMDEASSETLSAERNAFADHLKDLEGIFQTLIRNWGARDKLASTESGWADFQKLVTESEIKSKTMSEIAKRLPVEIQAMRLSR